MINYQILKEILNFNSIGLHTLSNFDLLIQYGTNNKLYYNVFKNTEFKLIECSREFIKKLIDNNNILSNLEQNIIVKNYMTEEIINLKSDSFLLDRICFTDDNKKLYEFMFIIEENNKIKIDYILYDGDYINPTYWFIYEDKEIK